MLFPRELWLPAQKDIDQFEAWKKEDLGDALDIPYFWLGDPLWFDDEVPYKGEHIDARAMILFPTLTRS